MYDRGYELYDVFGKDPTIQPSMRYTSKLAYEKSKLSVLDVQCQRPISRKEILNFIENDGQNASAVFSTSSVDTAYEEYSTLVGQLTNSDNLYVARRGVKREYGDESVTSYFTNIYQTENPGYPPIKYLLEETPNSIFIKTDAIFTDPFTAHKILSKRYICVDLNKNYPKTQTLRQFDDVINTYSWVTQIPFLNTYLVASATVMEIENNGIDTYELEIMVDDYHNEDDAYEHYIDILEEYSEDTKDERLNLIQKIKNKILTLTDYRTQ
jgi:hypothetical protein